MKKSVENQEAKGIAEDRWAALEGCACLGTRQTARALTRLYEERLRPLDLRATQFSVLAMLRGHSPRSMGELAEDLVVDRTTLTRVLVPLRKRKLVTVTPGSDARVHEASITAKGRALLADALPLWEAAQREVVAVLGPPGLERYLEGLGEARAAGNEARGKGPRGASTR